MPINEYFKCFNVAIRTHVFAVVIVIVIVLRCATFVRLYKLS